MTAKLIKDNDKIEYILVETEMKNLKNNNYVQTGCKIITEGNLRAVVFCFSNFDINDPCFKIQDNPDEPSYSIRFKGLFNNYDAWKSGEKVRVMYLNELDYRTFDKLERYFIERLIEFEYLTEGQHNITYAEFSDQWNDRLGNENNQIDDICKKVLGPKPRQTGNDDIIPSIVAIP